MPQSRKATPPTTNTKAVPSVTSFSRFTLPCVRPPLAGPNSSTGSKRSDPPFSPFASSAPQPNQHKEQARSSDWDADYAFSLAHAHASSPSPPAERSRSSTPNVSQAASARLQGEPLLSAEQQEVLDMAVQGHSLMFTGGAGTGKSVLVRALVRALRQKHGAACVGITATTGIAAVHIGGQTVHSWTGVGMGNGQVRDLVAVVLRGKERKERWRMAKVLVIDEVSMLDAVFFDKLEAVAREVRKNPLPFGGIQLILVGDFYQLPPVVTAVHRWASDRDDTRAKKTLVEEQEAIYPSRFLFDAFTWSRCVPRVVVLQHVFRQSDKRFVDMLEELRRDELSPPTIKAFQSLSRPLKTDDGILPTELYPTRIQVTSSNLARLHALRTPPHIYTARDRSNVHKVSEPSAARRRSQPTSTPTPKPRANSKRQLNNVSSSKPYTATSNTSSLPRSATVADEMHAWLDKTTMLPHTLELRLGAQVMMLKNCNADLVNGSRGTIVGFVRYTKDPGLVRRERSHVFYPRIGFEVESERKPTPRPGSVPGVMSDHNSLGFQPGIQPQTQLTPGAHLEAGSGIPVEPTQGFGTQNKSSSRSVTASSLSISPNLTEGTETLAEPLAKKPRFAAYQHSGMNGSQEGPQVKRETPTVHRSHWDMDKPLLDTVQGQAVQSNEGLLSRVNWQAPYETVRSYDLAGELAAESSATKLASRVKGESDGALSARAVRSRGELGPAPRLAESSAGSAASRARRNTSMISIPGTSPAPFQRAAPTSKSATRAVLKGQEPRPEFPPGSIERTEQYVEVAVAATGSTQMTGLEHAVPGHVYPLVRFVGGGVFLVPPMEHRVEDHLGREEGARTQVPLMLAWCMSIHKAQGMTLDRVAVHLTRSFERGQVYVALSRAVRLDALQVTGFEPDKVRADPKVKAWEAKVLQEQSGRRQAGGGAEPMAVPPLSVPLGEKDNPQASTRGRKAGSAVPKGKQGKGKQTKGTAPPSSTATIEAMLLGGPARK